MEDFFFDSWKSVIRTILSGVFAYIGLVAMLRLSGNRTLAQLNAFDLIVTVALGSTLSTVILNKDVTLRDGLVALAVLILLQYGIGLLSKNSTAIRRLIKTEPSLLFYRGHFLHNSLRKHRITNDEVLQVIRSNGNSNIRDIDAIVLETNGTFSVIKNLQDEGESSLAHVAFPDDSPGT